MYWNPYVNTNKSLSSYWQSHTDTPVTLRILPDNYRIRTRDFS